uniref:DUF1618 domain-containing protein n=1 Tax=Oryza glumipatula TaxID=40148 RepID=A0A0E0B6U6_9ORYZ
MEVGKPIKDSSLRPPAHGRDLLASWVSLTFGVASCLSMCLMTNLRQATSHCLHESGIGIDEGNASDVRDIAIDLEGCINYVEFEFKALPHPQRDSGSYIADGWTAAKWSWLLAHGLPPTFLSNLTSYDAYPAKLRHCPSSSSKLAKAPCGLHDAHLVHLMAKIEGRAHKAWILPIDLRNGVIQQPSDFAGADRTFGISETYVQTTISRYPRRKRRHRRRTGNNNNAIVPAVLDN